MDQETWQVTANYWVFGHRLKYEQFNVSADGIHGSSHPHCHCRFLQRLQAYSSKMKHEWDRGPNILSFASTEKRASSPTIRQSKIG
jgi:hypothetical protein